MGEGPGPGAGVVLPTPPFRSALTSIRILSSSSRILSAGRDLSGRGLIHSLMAVITPLSMNVSFKSCLRDKQPVTVSRQYSKTQQALVCR